MAHLSRWLADQGLDVAALTPSLAERFVLARREEGYASYVAASSTTVVLAYLRSCGVVAEPVAPVVDSSVEVLVEGYVRYLAQDKGLAVGTIVYYADSARVFFVSRPDPLLENLASLTGAEVMAYVMGGCGQRSIDSSKRVATSTRSLLRFLFAKGLVGADLASAVPTVAGWRPCLPRGVDPSVVTRLLDSCDRDHLVGRPDYAILLLLSRLGLRAGEVAALRLDDVNWRAGELRVPRGKTRRQDRLPLPADVGEALADYLHIAPDGHIGRALFIRVVAPTAGLGPNGVKQVVRHACDRAGCPSLGAHRLRHTVAIELLRAGAGLGEIAQLLRHRSESTTSIYAKVDRDSLRGLAQPWPGGAS